MIYSRGNKVRCEIPRGHAVLVCPYCRQELGFFDPKAIEVPVRPDMFQGIKPSSPDRRWAFPAAARNPKAYQWKDLACVFCSRPVFVDQSRGAHAGQHTTSILTRFGPWEIGDPAIPREETPEDERQRLIDQEWDRHVEETRTIEERNQEAIDREFPPEEPPPAPPADPKKPHVCPHCGQGFKHLSSLSRHVNHRCPKNPENK